MALVINAYHEFTYERSLINDYSTDIKKGDVYADFKMNYEKKEVRWVIDGSKPHDFTFLKR